MKDLQITSSAFEQGDWIPDHYSGFGDDISPELNIEGINENIEQGVAYGKHCYRGPKPPMNWNHEYNFTVYVLDTILSVSSESNRETVLKSAESHVLQQGMLIGKYQRKHKKIYCE